MQIINVQSIIGIEKSFIQAKMSTIAWETQIQKALEVCFAGLQNREGL